jgi:hypothetical protein
VSWPLTLPWYLLSTIVQQNAESRRRTSFSHFFNWFILKTFPLFPTALSDLRINIIGKVAASFTVRWHSFGKVVVPSFDALEVVVVVHFRMVAGSFALPQDCDNACPQQTTITTLSPSAFDYFRINFRSSASLNRLSRNCPLSSLSQSVESNLSSV